jgi:SpoVK/Ycf46/Vps4 family AAA+-type ATPase
MSETTDINKINKINKKLEENYKEKKEKGDLAGAYTNLLLYCNNKLALLGDPNPGINKEDLREKFQELKDIQDQVKSKISGGRGNDDAEESRVKQHELDPCDKKNCLLYKDVIGLEDQKRQILESFAYPIMFPKLYPKGTKGMLFYGPPGTGKTYIMKATVNQLQLMDENLRILYYSPTGAELKGKYVGETEKNIKAYFDVASKNAKSCEKKNYGKKYISIIFIDEVEAIAGDRASGDALMTNSVNTLLQMMDGVNSHENVAVVAATNYPWNLDSAILRRLQKRIHIKLPGYNEINQLMDSEFDKYLSIKSYIKDFDVNDFCKNKERDNSCQTEVCQFDDNSEESMYEEYDGNWKKSDGVLIKRKLLMNNEIDTLLRYNAAKCTGTTMVEEDKPPPSEDSFDTPEDKKKDEKDAEKDRPGFSNSDVSNYMNNVFTNAATRVKEGNFILTRIKDELVYLYEGSSYKLFPKIKPNPQVEGKDWLDENIIKKNPDYEIEYLKKISDDTFLTSNEAERVYLTKWLEKNKPGIPEDLTKYKIKAKALTDLFKQNGNFEYLHVPPPPSKRKKDDNGNYTDPGNDGTFCDFLKKEALNTTDSSDFEPEIISNPKNKNKLQIGDDLYKRFTEIKQEGINTKIDNFLEKNLTKLLNNKHVKSSFDNMDKEIHWYNLRSFKKEEYKEFNKLKKYTDLYSLDAGTYKFKSEVNQETEDKKTEIYTFFKRKIMTVCDEIRGNFYVKTGGSNATDLKFLLTFETEVKNKNSKRIEDLCYHCYGFITFEKLLQFVFDDIYKCYVKIFKKKITIESSGGGKKTKKNIKYKNLTKKKQIGGGIAYIEPVYDTQLISIMSELSNFEKMLFLLDELKLSKTSVNLPDGGDIKLKYKCNFKKGTSENFEYESRIYFSRMLSELTKKTTSGKKIKENEYNKDQTVFDDSEEVNTIIDKYIEEKEKPSTDKSKSVDFFDLMFKELALYKLPDFSPQPNPPETKSTLEPFKGNIKNLEKALSLNNKIQAIVTNLEKFKDLESQSATDDTSPEKQAQLKAEKAKLEAEKAQLKGELIELNGKPIDDFEIRKVSDDIVKQLIENIEEYISQCKNKIDLEIKDETLKLKKTIKKYDNLKSDLENRRGREVDIENLDNLLKLLNIINPKDPQSIKRYQAIKDMDKENGDMSFDQSAQKIINISKKQFVDQIMEIIDANQDIQQLLKQDPPPTEESAPTHDEEPLKTLVSMITALKPVDKREGAESEVETQKPNYDELLEQILVFVQKEDYETTGDNESTIKAINSIIGSIKEILKNNKGITESIEKKKIDYFTNNKGIVYIYILKKDDKKGEDILINKFFKNFFKITYFTKNKMALSTVAAVAALYFFAPVSSIAYASSVLLLGHGWIFNKNLEKIQKDMENLFKNIDEDEKITVIPITKQSEDVSTASYKHLLRNFHLDQGDFNEASNNIKSSINPVEVLRLNHYDKTNRNPCTDEQFLKENKSAECSKK